MTTRVPGIYQILFLHGPGTKRNIIKVVTSGLSPEHPHNTSIACSFVNVIVANEIDFDKLNIPIMENINFASTPTITFCKSQISLVGLVSSTGRNTIRQMTNNAIKTAKCHKYIHGILALAREMIL